MNEDCKTRMIYIDFHVQGSFVGCCLVILFLNCTFVWTIDTIPLSLGEVSDWKQTSSFPCPSCFSRILVAVASTTVSRDTRSLHHSLQPGHVRQTQPFDRGHDATLIFKRTSCYTGGLSVAKFLGRRRAHSGQPLQTPSAEKIRKRHFYTTWLHIPSTRDKARRRPL